LKEDGVRGRGECARGNDGEKSRRESELTSKKMAITAVVGLQLSL